MKKIALFSAAALFAYSSAMAQETYENAKIADQDLNGTARYIGMGGALDALGADISTISSNPAGIGLFRHSSANVSFGIVSQQDCKTFANGKKTNLSFDQIGFVYSRRTGRSSFMNFAFNYHKSKNFDFILSATGKLDGLSSQNKQTFLKSQDQYFDLSDKGGAYVGNDNSFNQIDYLYANTLLPVAFDDKNKGYIYDYFGASDFDFNRTHSGYIGTYDFNLSGNINDRVYLGITFGIHDVHYKSYGEYTEALLDSSDKSSDKSIGKTSLSDNRKVTGTGFDVKAGIIFRPVESSPFRIGLSIATPIWYDLTTTNYTTIDNRSLADNFGYYDTGNIGESYDFKLYTPWKFGLSLGTTFDNYLAIGAGYEYSDYSTLDSRINDGGDYDWYYDTYYSNSSSDGEMNDHTESTLKGVSTLKLGMEFKADDNLAIRLGYNYVSPKYESVGYKDGTINSPGSYYASTTDYTNWESTNRVTCGIGYTLNKFSLDLAYQYSVQNGKFHAFTDYISEVKDMSNLCDAVKVSNKRHQLLLTLGYHF